MPTSLVLVGLLFIGAGFSTLKLARQHATETRLEATSTPEAPEPPPSSREPVDAPLRAS